MKWVKAMIDSYVPQIKSIKPKKTPLVIDATFIKGRTTGFLVFRSPTLKKNLSWYEIEGEHPNDYVIGINELISKGFEITGIVVDGKPGVIESLEKMGFKVQMCQFHQVQIVTRYITKRPRLEASKELRSIILLLTKTDQASFEYWIEKWHNKWKDFLNEKIFDLEKNKQRFTHERLRKAYRSIKRHFPYLFTFQQYPSLNIPNTTNSLDGTFGHLKDKIRIHRGLKWKRKIKLIYELLNPK